MNPEPQPQWPALISPVIQFAVRVFSAAVICLVAGIAYWHRDQANLDPPAQPSAADSNYRIDINKAGMRDWTLMPGIGALTAQRILDDREQNGPFLSLQDLQRVPGIGVKTVKDLEPYCLPVNRSAIDDGTSSIPSLNPDEPLEP